MDYLRCSRSVEHVETVHRPGCTLHERLVSGDVWTALNEVLRTDTGEAWWLWSSAGIQDRMKPGQKSAAHRPRGGLLRFLLPLTSFTNTFMSDARTGYPKLSSQAPKNRPLNSVKLQFSSSWLQFRKINISTSPATEPATTTTAASANHKKKYLRPLTESEIMELLMESDDSSTSDISSDSEPDGVVEDCRPEESNSDNECFPESGSSPRDTCLVVNNSLPIGHDPNIDSDDLLSMIDVPDRLFGKNKCKWCGKKPNNIRCPARNKDVLTDIAKHTNAEIVVQRAKYTSDRYQNNVDDADKDTEAPVRPSFTRDTDVTELKAFFGLYYLASVLKVNSVTTRELFDKRTEYCTVAEQLFGFHGRCVFKMFIPLKPDKYGIKILMMCDAKTFYLLNAQVYTSKDSTPKGTRVAQYYFTELNTPIHGSNRNCTFDNCEHTVAMVDTMKSNKSEISPLFKGIRGRKRNSAMFAFSGEETLLSYCPPKKKKKIVAMLSTMHDRKDEDKTVRIPEIIEFYNATKGDVDCFDKLCHTYSVSRKTRRWPLCIFYGLQNAVGIN
ncbi:hypothetical protein PR048_021102 [Dryococelus australis]|uniref:PiggyBac transposable element-derived protein domain-containing protein n=1 Tax=Dryococelus australis TaxID=614101 RepID=A0ABQ9GXB4_9NEOP|nr:hypothetical protein PR048_021102 [Dryococelus australis]